MNIFKKRTILAAALAISGVLVIPQTAAAHKPVISGSTQCADNGWSVDWTVAPSADHPDLVWQIRRPSSAYSPDGGQASNISSSFTRTTFHSLDTTSVTETAWADWVDPLSGLVIAQSTRSATVVQPEDCIFGLLGEAEVPAVPTPPAAASPAQLPSTGSNSTAWGAGLAIMLVGFGLVLTLASRPKRSI
jgi:LPXTG-motif cell wall-anchored protein